LQQRDAQKAVDGGDEANRATDGLDEVAQEDTKFEGQSHRPIATNYDPGTASHKRRDVLSLAAIASSEGGGDPVDAAIRAAAVSFRSGPENGAGSRRDGLSADSGRRS
jgi:hypothetical protein